jgi:hypothetical protein
MKSVQQFSVQFCFNTIGKTHPETSHDPFPKAPLTPHLTHNHPQPLVSGTTVLALHPHFEHLNWS